MSARITIYATRDKSAQAVENALKLQRTGKKGPWLKYKQSAARLPNGYYAVVCQAHWGLEEQELKGISGGGDEVIACNVIENISFSQIALWRDGRRIWQATHDQESKEELAVEGSPPSELAEIRERVRTASGGGAACFEIPIALMGELVGVRYDQKNSLQWHELAPLENRTFFQRLCDKLGLDSSSTSI